jgi:hypothetical protein
MRNLLHIMLLLLALVSWVANAGAIDNATSESQTNSEYPSQPIQLSTEQEKFVWQRIHDQLVTMTPPPLSSLPVRPGQHVPNDVPLQPLPDDVTSVIPSLKGYAYTIVQDRLMVVNPSDKTVGHVIDTNQRSIR